MSVDAKNDSESLGDQTQQDTLGDLRECQRSIVTFRHKCDKEIDEIERTYSQNVKPYLKRRNLLIQNIPQFWSKSILNHPLLSTVFEPGESDVLGYLTNLEVDEDPEQPDYFKIDFFFKKNPYFENRTLTKEFKENGSTNAPVRWQKGQRFPKTDKHDLWEDDDLGLEYKGFFRWYFDPTEHYCDPIADIIKTCLWYNPMEFYEVQEGRKLERARQPIPNSSRTAGGTTKAAKEKSPKKIKKPSSTLGN